MVSDPIADMLTRVRNALKARHPKVDVPSSKLKMEIARILKEQGYILNFKVVEEGAARSIRIYLKYTPANQPVISHIERISKPGCRSYAGGAEIPKVLGGLGINIVTTSKGVMTGADARRQGVGGEILCQLW
jgi:small subunit ribosomal protein S8